MDKRGFPTVFVRPIASLAPTLNEKQQNFTPINAAPVIIAGEDL